jgi:RNA polymerase sigma-70 factor, ECF subfamily
MAPADPFERLLREARTGRAPAIRRLHAEHNAALVRYVRAFEPLVADEVAGDVWLSVALGIRAFRGERPEFRAWLFTIARARLRELRASAPLRRAFAGGDGRVGPRGEAAMPPHVQALAAVGHLPAVERDVILLRALGDLSLREVGLVLRLRPSAARAAEGRGLARLADALERRAVRA